METLKDYVVFINGFLTLTVIGFIIRFSSMMKDSFKDKEDLLLKKIDSIQDDLSRTEKWAKRKEEELIKEKNDLNSKLESILSDANVDLKSNDILEVVKSLDGNFKNSIKEMTEKIENLKLGNTENNVEFNLSMAKAFAANGEWIKAAQQFEIITKTIDNSWELYFSQGVAYANSRGGKDAYLKSLQSYSSAITFMPDEISLNIKARLYIYRGALMKRLKRLREAESDIKIGLENAEEENEINDGLYNLACIYAMQNRKMEFLESAGQLKFRNKNKFNYLQVRLAEYAPKFVTVIN